MNIQQLETRFPSPILHSTVSRNTSRTIGNGWADNAVALGRGTHEQPWFQPGAVDATFVMVDEMVQHALQDAAQTYDVGLRWEALAWLWVCCPDLADQLLSPTAEALPENIDFPQKAAAYLERYPA